MYKLIRYQWLWMLLAAFSAFSCNNKKNNQEVRYTCPMPQDSVFSNEPGKCPKCGMDLIMVEPRHSNKVIEPGTGVIGKTGRYTCPMHPQVLADSAGICPVCGMQLEKVKPENETGSVSLDVLLKPVNRQVVAAVPMVHMMAREEDIEMESFGFVFYDTRQAGVISSNFSGRIEQLYVQYQFQEIKKGQKIMDVYSPELLTAQENLLFLLKHDPGNESLIAASKQKLLLLGMSNQQLKKLVQTGNAAYTVSIYSNYTGHIHEMEGDGYLFNNQVLSNNDFYQATAALSIKDGMYLKKGQNIFTVFNPNKAWVLLNIFAGQAAMVKVGDKVRIQPEFNPQKDFRASISYIEPFYREGSKTLTARVYFDNTSLAIPIGSQVKATVFAGYQSANWLPEEAVLSLGLDKVVFVRSGESFAARKIETGMVNKHLIQVLNGLDNNEAVAANAQYLVDSESFIKTN